MNLDLGSDIGVLHKRLSMCRKTTVGDITAFIPDDELRKIQTCHLAYCIPFNSLSIPKGIDRPTCCICSDWARIVCGRCHNTYYCNRNHAAADNVHGEMCELMSFTRSKPRFLISKLARAQLTLIRNAQTDYVLKKFYIVGTRNLSLEKYMDANTAFQQAIYFAVKNYGHKSPKLCDLFILKSLCSIGLARYADAFTEINKAEFSFKDDPKDKNNDFVKAHIVYTYGLIYKAAEDWNQALKLVGDALIIIAFRTGPNSIKTARLYFEMAEIFFYMNRFEESNAYYSLALKAYIDWLVLLFNEFYLNFEFIISEDTLDGAKPSLLPTLTSPFYFETESIKHIKRLTLRCAHRKDNQFGQCLLFMSLMSLFKGLYDESHRFAERAKSYLEVDYLKSLAKEIHKLIALHKEQEMLEPIRKRQQRDAKVDPKNLSVAHRCKEAFKKALEKRSEDVVSVYLENGFEFDKVLQHHGQHTEDEKVHELIKGDPFEFVI